MSKQSHAVLRILLCAIGLIAAAAIYAATEDAAAENVGAKHFGAKRVVTRDAGAQNSVAKNAAAKRGAAKEAATNRMAAKIAVAKNAAAKRAAAKKAAGKGIAAKVAPAKNVPLAVSLARLAGSWRGDKSGLKVKIEQGSIGWEAWLSTDGQARITQPEADPKIIKIQSRNITCTYTVIMPGPQTMKWAAAPGQPNSGCLGDSFTKLGLAPAKVSAIAPARPTVQAKPIGKRRY